MNFVQCSDCSPFLNGISSDSVDLVCTDPPYFRVCKEEWDNQWETTDDYLAWMASWTDEAIRVLKPGGALYVFGGIGPRNGFAFWNYVQQTANNIRFASYINWRRFRGKGYKGLHNNWPDSREDIAYFVKGDKPKTFHKQYMHEAGLSSASKKRFEKDGVGLSCTNIWIDIPECQLDGGLNRTLMNPAEKPIKLMERIISASTNEGDVVLDCFTGTGATAVAATKLNRQCLACDSRPDYVAIANSRIILLSPSASNSKEPCHRCGGHGGWPQEYPKEFGGMERKWISCPFCTKGCSNPGS